MTREHEEQLREAVGILRRGGLVAFPTETVYGLGADATNADAVARIFAAKGRPSTNPLIVHVASAAVARRYAADWPEIAEKLTQAFWPGPLTLVLPKGPSIVPAVTAGRDTVGLRAPDHPLTLALLRWFDGPVAGPSANRSTRVSPTTAQHVHDELGHRVDMILDGGPCRVGIESTVLDLLDPTHPRILRPGGVSRQAIERVIGIAVEERAHHVHDPTQAATSPGQHAIHYAPHTPAYRFEKDRREEIANRPGRVAWVAIGAGVSTESRIVMPDDPAEYARRLYATLRELDGGGWQEIWVEMPPDRPEWAAVRDRLMRATKPAP